MVFTDISVRHTTERLRKKTIKSVEETMVKKEMKERKNVIKTEVIENYLSENNLSKTKFCKMCKISYSTLKRIMNNENFNLIALFKIARVLNLHVHQLVI